MNDDKTTIPAGFFKAGQTVKITASGTFVPPPDYDRERFNREMLERIAIALNPDREHIEKRLYRWHK